MKYILIAIMLNAGVALAQSSTQMQYTAYLNTSNTFWERSVEMAIKESGEGSFEHAVALYGLLNNTMASRDEDTFDKYVDNAKELLDELIESKTNIDESRALLSSVYGLIMGYSPMKGMFYGGKSSSLISTAMENEPGSPLVQKLFAGSKLYTPEMWGGDPQKSAESFEEAIRLFSESGSTDSWLYLDSHVGLSMAYQKLDRNEDAIDILEKVLVIEPNYGWAKNILEKLQHSEQ